MVPDDPLDQVIENAIKGGIQITEPSASVRRFRRKTGGPPAVSYEKALADRHIDRSQLYQILQAMSEWAARWNLMGAVTLAIALGFLFGFLMTCNGPLSGLSPECRPSTFDETRMQISVRGETVVDPLPKKTHVEHVPLSGDFFNGSVFSGWLVLAAFVLAFTRWQIGSSQAAMSETFQRKRDSNLFIINNHTDIKELVNEAVDVKTDTRRPKKTSFSEGECKALLADFRINPWGTRGPEFKQVMFVYIELDNLEFALMKYKIGYLAPEQMYRACEIFESRCRSKLFRYITVHQGLKFYTAPFHELIINTLIYGYTFSSDNAI